MSIGIGLGINNARAVIEALMDKDSGEFARTPKYGIERESDDWQGKKIPPDRADAAADRVSPSALLHGHGLLRAGERIYGTLPFLMLFQVGFLYTGLLSIVQQFGGDDMALRTQAAGE